MPHTISHHPQYGWRWWDHGETLPAIEQRTRPATGAESVLIERLRAAANRNVPADRASAALRALMEANAPDSKKPPGTDPAA